MKSRVRVVSWALWSLGILLDAGFGLLIVATWGSPHTPFGGFPVAALVSQAAVITIAAVVTSRVPRNAVGWLFYLLGFANLTTNFAALYAIRGLEVAPGSLPVVVAVAWFGSFSWIGEPIALVLLLHLFPDGRALSRRWRPLPWLGGVAAVLLMLLFAEQTFPLPGWQLDSHGEILNSVGTQGGVAGAMNGPAGALTKVMFMATVVAAVAGVFSAVVRFRRSQGQQRQQLKWFVGAGGLLVVCLAGLVSQVITSQPDSSIQPFATAVNLSIGVLVLASGIAILRYRLYDIDIVISRTLVYGGLAIAITAVYLALIVGVGSLIGSRANLVLAIAATAIVGLAFQPARAQIQRYANRLVYGKRATPYEVLSELNQRVAESVATDELPQRMARVLAEATAAERADVWLRIGDEIRSAAAWPESAPALPPLTVNGQALPSIPGADRALPVLHQGELLGALSLVRRPGDAMTPVEEKLLADLAHQAGLVLRNVQLTAELVERLEELRASRQRLVAAQDMERRRLERNLHDGAQQNLVALKVKLGLLENIAEQQPAKAKQLAGELKVDADETLDTLRDLARGIYPPLLADKGLAAALEAQARKATLPVEVDAEGVGRYPQELEAAIYFCVLEALQNVQKYAGATTAHVQVAVPNGRLEFTVVDDGAGFDSERVSKGAGLQNMVDRLEALGGELQIEARPGEGTRVIGALPLVAGAAGTAGDLG